MGTDWQAIEDGALIGKLSGGPASAEEKQQACAEIYRRYAPVMLRFARTALQSAPGTRVEPIDVVQETFAHLLRPEVAQRFLPSRPLWPWLRKVVLRKAIDLRRKEYRHRTPGNDRLMADLPARPAEPRLLDRDAVEALLRDLPPWQQTLCRLYYLEERDTEEVASSLGWDVPRVYREAHKLKALLRSRCLGVG
jgi:RNA polymerase sigma factor (sigma-70 family)